MFRNVSGDGQSPSSPAGVAPVGLDSRDSSWIGLVSRPLSLLQKLLPGRLRSAALAETGPGWFPGDLKTSFVQEENDFLRQLDDILPLAHHAPPHLTYLRCQHEAAAALPEPGPSQHLPWITAESVQETAELQSTAEMSLDICQQAQFGYFSNIRTFLNQVLLSSQDLKPAGGKDWVPEVVRNKPWWGSFLGQEESSETGQVTKLSQPEQGTETVCPQTETVCPQTSAERTGPVFVQRGCRESILGENTGASDYKEPPSNNGGLHTVQNTEGSTADHLSCSNTVLPAPDQDHGYSSLEEEQSQRSHLYKARAPGEDLPQQGADTAESLPAVRIEMEDEETTVEESTKTTPLAAPQNKTIAFIMGCPCSDDESDQLDHQSTEEDDDDDDDDGFDSEGSSDCSTSSEEDEDEDSDSEPDSESERLWNSLNRTLDPYNPRNFTACLHTGSTRPRTIPTPASSTESTPSSSPEASPLLTSSPPSSSQDSWDDSTSASEVDEAESLRLLNSFSCSSDPYSPFNFQAPLRTRGPTGSPLKTTARVKTHSPPSPPVNRQQEAEERLDSGFSESNTTSQTCRRSKKVHFCDDVEEFFASCGEEEEDRRGPWEELARDRWRFLRRCQEVEQSIGFCLQPQHRLRVYRRLAILHVQEA